MLSSVQAPSAPAPASVAQTPAVVDHDEAERRELTIGVKTLAALDKKVKGLEARLAKGLGGETAEQRAEHQETSSRVYPKREELMKRMEELRRKAADWGDQTSTEGAQAEIIVPATSPADGDPAHPPALTSTRLPLQPSPSSPSVPQLAQQPPPAQLTLKRKAKESTGVNGAQKPEASSKRRLPNDHSTEGTTTSAPIPMQVDDPAVSVPTAPLPSFRAAVPTARLPSFRAAVPTAPLSSFRAAVPTAPLPSFRAAVPTAPVRQRPAASSHRQPVLKSFWAQAPPAARLPPAQPLPTGPSSAVKTDRAHRTIPRPLASTSTSPHPLATASTAPHQFSDTAAAQKHRDQTAKARATGAHQAAKDARRAELESTMDTFVKGELEKHVEFVRMASRPDSDFASALEHVKEIANLVAAQFERERFKADGVFAKHLESTPRIADCFRAIAREGPSFDPRAWPDVLLHVGTGNVKDEASDDGEDDASEDTTMADGSSPVKLTLYMRQIVGTVADHKQWSSAYVAEKPADRFREAPFVASISEMDDATLVSRFYGGISHRGSGLDRAAEDAEGPAQSRYTSFTSVNKLVDQVQHYSVALEGPAFELAAGANNWDMMAHVPIQDAEELFVAVLGFAAALNSARGRMRTSWTPSAHLLSHRDNVSARCRDIAAGVDIGVSIPTFAKRPILRPSSTAVPSVAPPPPTVPAPQSPRATVVSEPLLSSAERELVRRNMVQTVESYFYRMADHYAARDDVGPKIGEDALKEVVLSSSAITITPDGYAASSRVLDDITRAEFFFEKTGSSFWNAKAGHGPHSQRATLVHAYDLDLEHLEATAANTTLDVIANNFGPFIDLWVVTLVHEDIRTALVFLIQYMIIVNCSAMILTSARMAGLFSEDIGNKLFVEGVTLDNLWSFPDSSDCIGDDVKFKTWKQLPIEDWIDKVGLTIVVSIFPGEAFFRLFLLLLHFGILKHDPTLEPLLRRLLFLVELKARLMFALVAALRPAHTLAALSEVRKVLEDVCERCGLAAAIEEARAEARKAHEVLRGLRQLASLDHQLHADAIALAEATEDGLTLEEAQELVKETRWHAKAVRCSSTIQSFNARCEAAVDQPGSEDRRTRCDELIALAERGKLSGVDALGKTAVPTPYYTSVGTPEWKSWYLGLPAGRNVYRSATGSHPQPERSEPRRAEWKNSYARRAPKMSESALARHARERAEKGVANLGELPLEDALVLLAGTTLKKAQGEKSRREIVHLYCKTCGESFIGGGGFKNSVHRCVGSDGCCTERRPSDREMVCKRPLYPAALLDLAGVYGTERDDVLASTGLVESRARSHVPVNAELSAFKATSDPPIYALASTPPSLLHDMAIDALVLDAYPCPGESESDDYWWDDGFKAALAVLTHIATGGKEIFCQSTCRCRTYQLFVDNNKQHQHFCSAAGTDKKGNLKKRTSQPDHRLDVRKALKLPRDLLRRLVYAVSLSEDALRTKETINVRLRDVLGWAAK